MKLRYAIYARYSSDLQSDRSIEDQVDACNASLEKSDPVAKLYVDRAMSGSRMNERIQILELLKDAEKKLFDIVITESLDRLSRDMENISYIYKILTFNGIRIKTLHEGEIGPFHVGISGAMSTVNMKQLKERIKRGQRGNIKFGKHAGGLPYGYSVKLVNENNVPERGLREIHIERGKIVMFIFNEYSQGTSPTVIARKLNIMHVPSPQGKEWTLSTIIGSYKRQEGILQNPIYKGELVWGRIAQLRHPVTNKRIIDIRPSTEWEINKAPHLQIVSDELWEACRLRRSKEYRVHKKRYTERKKSLTVLCGHCDRKMRKKSLNYYSCLNYEYQRGCEQKKSISVIKLLQELAKTIFEKEELPKISKKSQINNTLGFDQTINSISEIMTDIFSAIELFKDDTIIYKESSFKKIRTAEQKFNELKVFHKKNMNTHILNFLNEKSLMDGYLKAKKMNSLESYFLQITNHIKVHHQEEQIIIEVDWNLATMHDLYSEQTSIQKCSA